jgi:hypothetical protein
MSLKQSAPKALADLSAPLKSHGHLILYFYIIALVIKLVCIASLDVAAIPHGHDELFFVDSSLRAYWWPSHYDHMTAIKEPLWPLVMGALKQIGLPLRVVMECLLWGGALWAAQIALPKENKLDSILRALLFILLFWHPLAVPTFERTTYDGFFGILFTLALASLFYITRATSPTSLFKRVTLFSIILGLLSITRGEGGVILIAGILAALIASFSVRDKEPALIRAKSSLYVVLISLVCTVSIQAPVRIMNKLIYQNWAISEQQEHHYSRAMRLLAEIEPKTYNPHVPIALESIRRASAFSPRAALILKEFEGDLGRFWSPVTFGHPVPKGEIGGGWVHWAVRDALYRNGYYSSPLVAQKFYKQLGDELESAFQNGHIPRRRVLHHIIGPIPTLASVFHSAGRLISACFIRPEYIPIEDYPDYHYTRRFDKACNRRALSIERTLNQHRLMGIGFNRLAPRPLVSAKFRRNNGDLLNGTIYHDYHSALPTGEGRCFFTFEASSVLSGTLILEDSDSSTVEFSFINGNATIPKSSWLLEANRKTANNQSSLALSLIKNYKTYYNIWNLLMITSLIFCLGIGITCRHWSCKYIPGTLAALVFLGLRFGMASAVDSTAFFMTDSRYIFPLAMGTTIVLISSLRAGFRSV